MVGLFLFNACIFSLYESEYYNLYFYVVLNFCWVKNVKLVLRKFEKVVYNWVKNIFK